VKTRPRNFLRATTLIVALLVAVATGITIRNRDDGAVHVIAMFQDASPLRPGNLVKEYGVQVGLIESVRLVHGQAQVEMRVQRGALPLHVDASAQIRPVSLIGERFIELDRGSDSAPLQTAPWIIAANRTSSAVNLDDVLNTFDDPTSTALAAVITTLGEGLNGHGNDVAAALTAVKPALAQVDQLTSVLTAQNASLNRILDIGQLHASAFADRDGATLNALVSAAQKTLSITAADREPVNEAIAQLPATLISARRTLQVLAGAADATTPVLASVRPVTDELVQISHELHQFADAVDPALTSLPPVLTQLNTMLDDARPVVERLRPAANDLHSVTGSVRPIAERLLVHAPGTPSSLENLMTTLADWAMTTNGYDGVSHYFRGAAIVTPEMARKMVAGFAPPALVPAHIPAVPGSILPGPAASIPGLFPNLVPPSHPKDPGNATGLSEEQEKSMVGELLGGGR
jgi:phospholipid/cholesterol/gamma-HCH transport system substrate-binding protein